MAVLKPRLSVTSTGNRLPSRLPETSSLGLLANMALKTPADCTTRKALPGLRVVSMRKPQLPKLMLGSLETTDAMEDGHQVLLNMLQPMELLHNQNILMLVEIKAVLKMEEVSKFQAKKVSQDVQAYHQESILNLFQSLLMLQIGDHTEVVSSIIVEPELIMQSS